MRHGRTVVAADGRRGGLVVRGRTSTILPPASRGRPASQRPPSDPDSPGDGREGKRCPNRPGPTSVTLPSYAWVRQPSQLVTVLPEHGKRDPHPDQVDHPAASASVGSERRTDRCGRRDSQPPRTVPAPPPPTPRAPRGGPNV